MKLHAKKPDPQPKPNGDHDGLSSSTTVTTQDLADTANLVRQYKPLVHKIARKIYKRIPQESTVDFNDLTQAGYVGLLDAASKYDASHGASFTTYAGIRINGTMLDEIRKGDWTPRSVYKQIRSIERARQEIESKNGRPASEHEIAHEISISISALQQMKNDIHGIRLYRTQQLENPFDDPEHIDPFLDTVPGHVTNPMDQAALESARDALSRSISKLPNRDAQLLTLYYNTDLNLREVGALHSVTESRASQIVKDSINLLADSLSEHA